MQNPFADLIPQQPAQGTPRGGAPIVAGTPKAPDPFRVRDQQLQEEAAQRAREAEARAREDQAFQREKFEREMAKPGISDPKLVEAERTAAFLTTRLVGSLQDIDRATKANPDAAKPGLGATVAGLLGNEARNWANSPERRRVEAAQMDVLDAALTLGTGAAYTREQLEGYRESYFPKMTDDDATAAEKRTRLLRVIEAAKLKAGGAAPKIDEALARLGMVPTAAPSQRPGVIGEGDIGFAGARDENPLNTEQQSLYDAFWKTNPNATREQFASFVTGALGLPGGNIDEIIKARDEGRGVMPGRNAARPNVDISQERGPGGIGQTIDAGVRGAADVLTLGMSDELAAAGETLFNGGTMRDNLAEQRAIDAHDTEKNFGARLTGQIAGGFALPMGRPASVNALARTGGAYGGAYGFGSGEGNLLDRGVNALSGAAAGAAGGYVLGKGAQALGARLPTRLANPGTEVAEAAGRLDIPLIPADVGGAMTRRVTGAAAQAPLSAGPIVRAAERTLEASGVARDRIAGAAGAVLPEDEAGAAVRAGADLFIRRTSERGSRLYDRARDLSGNISIDAKNAVQAVDRHIAELSEAGELGAPIISEMTKIKKALDGGITVQGLRTARTLLGGLARTDALRGTDVKRRFGEVLDAASQDIEQGLVQAGRGAAAKMFGTADRFWKARVEQIDEVLEPIVGKNKSGEDIFGAVERMAQGKSGGVQRLSRLMASLPADEAASVRATIISRMGSASAGAQNAAGDAFSPATFLTQWSRMSGKGKSVLFGNSELRSSLDDLAKVTGGIKAAQRYGNHSNSTGGVVGNVMVGGLAGAVPGIGPVNAMAALGLQYATGRLMASPRFVKWLARAPKDPGAQSAHVGRLTTLATREPAIRGEIMQLQQRIVESLNAQAPRATSVAASDGSQTNNQQ